MSDVVLVLNAGSSSIKFSVFEAEGENIPLFNGQVEGLYTAPRSPPSRPSERASAIANGAMASRWVMRGPSPS